MTHIRVKGFKIFIDRYGHMRCYHRETRHKIDLIKMPIGTAAFFAECAKISAIEHAKEEIHARPGTLGNLMAHFAGHDHFANLSPATQRDYRWCSSYLKAIGYVPVHSLDTPMIAGIHDQASTKHGWRRGNYILTYLRQVFKYALPNGLIKNNPALGVIPKKRPKNAAYANRPWSIAEERIVLAAASPALRVALALMANTGLDPSDAIRLQRTTISGETVYGLRGKTQVKVAVPIGDRLRAALAAAPVHDATTILASTYGRPWTYDGLSSAFHRLKRKLEETNEIAPGLTMKGLRHTVATTLREAGVDDRRIADLLGQKTTSMAGHYSRSADLAAKNQNTIRTLDKANEQRTEVVKPFPKAVKPK